MFLMTLLAEPFIGFCIHGTSWALDESSLPNVAYNSDRRAATRG
jgi:hypothetical protein